jgi:type II secretory pathway component GspD/PulD (secretin)
MWRSAVAVLAAIFVLGTLCAAQGTDRKTVTLDVTNTPLKDVAVTLAQTSGVTIHATDAAGEAPVTLNLPETDLSDAVPAVAEAIDGSWLRTYVIEPVGREPAEETTADVLARLQVAWRDWMFSRTDEELDAFRERALAAMGGAPTAPQPTASGGMMFDMVDTLQAPFRAEQVSLKLNAAELPEALGQFTLACGYITLLSTDVTGQVTLDVTDEELPKVLDALCAQVNAQWRPLYIIGKAREVSPDEMEQRFTQMLEQGAAEFWKQSPEQRADIIQRITDRMAKVPPEVRTAIKNSPWTSRIMGRAMQFVFTLTPDQRREITPLLQGAVKLFGQ